MTGGLTDLRRDLVALVDQGAVDEFKHAAGQAAKKAASTAAERDLGGDAAFSGFRRRVPLRAGYDMDPGTRLTVNLSPKGLWMLANDGRRRRPASGRVYPRKARGGLGSKALNTPWGPRRSVRASTTSGFGTLKDAEIAIERDAIKAVDVKITQKVGRF